MRRVVWTKIATPLGDVFVAARDGRVVALSYGEDGGSFLREIGRMGDLVWDDGALRPVARQLEEYFAGERTHFDVEVDLSGLTPFQQAVLRATLEIPYGMVRSYKEVAEAAGRPGAARAAGAALGNNPVGIIVPCHRVIASDGSIGGFSSAGGVETKRRLLELEGVRLA